MRGVFRCPRLLRGLLLAAGLCLAAPAARAAPPEPPPHLPRYHFEIDLDTKNHRADLRETVTWTNTTSRPVNELVFNFYPHYVVPEGDYVLLAKTLELVRVQPSQGIDRRGRHGVVKEAARVAGPQNPRREELGFTYDRDSMTTIRVPLPAPVLPGESVTVELRCELHLPNKQGRWGHWNGVTFLTNALPLVAYCDDSGWRPTPFVPWHQPWCNEAGVFTANITLPDDEVLACPAVIKSDTRLGDGRKRVETREFVGRDFALLTSSRYRDFRGETTLPDGRVVGLHVVAFPEHEFYAREILKIVAEALPVFSQWFGPFPYPQFTIAESFFGWNGNECAGLVMIDERVFGMPHLLRGYAEYLVSHETCHQWWYNLVGTDGYSEPFMDEGAATYFTHRLLDQKNGKNNNFIEWPDGLGWLPNIRRENYRFSAMYSAVRNGQMQPAAQDLPRYGHLFGLFTGAYDRGSKVFGMIEARLGDAAFLDFTRGVVARYGWRVLHAADLRRELEEYTGQSWGEFFDRWVYGKGMTDWEVRSVSVRPRFRTMLGGVGPRTVAEVTVAQTREHTEPTVLGFTLRSGETVRVPVGFGDGPVSLPELNATVTPLGGNRWEVRVELPEEPEQVTVDPDGVLLDANPGNNRWKPDVRARVTPLYSFLDEADYTNDYDRWNFTAGPWVWGQAYPDPWYTRSTMAGLRAGSYRTQKFVGGAYAAYRTDFRDLVIGADATWLLENQQIGLNYERRVGGPYGRQDGYGGPQRAVAYHRQIFKQSSSLYLPPMVYGDTFVTYQDNFLPFARTTVPGAERFDSVAFAGYHFRANLYTPYWDPECGYWIDLMAGAGEVRMPSWGPTGQFRTELAAVRQLPDWAGPLRTSRLAARLVTMGALPDRGQFFALGGGTLFRGYSLAQRQGSLLWVANAELRIPLARDVEWDCLDHCFGARNLWLATFYDVGDVYANGRSVGGRVAHAVGGGLRMDLAVFSFIERATLRLDAGKTINDSTPWQFWFGVQHAF